MLEKDIERIKDVIQDSNLNFLIGSGASVPFIDTLGNIETWLTDLVEYNDVNEDVFKTLDEVRAKAEEYMLDYNHHRPHKALKYRAPADLLIEV